MAWTLAGNPQHLSVSTAATNQLIAWNFDPAMTNNPYPPGTGKCLAVRCYVDSPASVGHFYTYVITAGSGLANCYIGLYSVAGSLLAQTADISTSLQATGNIVAPISGAAYAGLTKNQEIYLCLLIGSGTSPNFTSASPTAGVANLGLSSNYRWQTGGTALTALPATFPTMGAGGAEPPFLAIGA